MANWYKEVFKRDDPALRQEVGRLVAASRAAPAAREAGAVVEFVREGQLLCGVIRGRPTNRATHILLGNGREVTVRGDKIVHVSSERVAPDRPNAARRQLERLDGQRDWSSRGVDVGTLWEVAREERGEEGAWELAELAALYYASEPASGDQAVLLRALWRGEWFARRGSHWHPLAADVVASRRGERNRRDRTRQHGETISAWLRRVADGQPAEPRPDGADEAVALLEEVALYGAEAPRATEAARLMKGAHLHGPGAAVDVLARLGHWTPDENLDLRRSGAPLVFGAAAEEASRVVERGAGAWPAAARRGARVWFSRPVGLVSEGEQCLLAASVRRWPRGWRAVVYVPALSLLTPAGSNLDEEARVRGVALRLPDQHLPLVPEPLLDAVSLTTERAVPCLAVEMYLGRDLSVRRCRLNLRRVRVRSVWWDAGAGPGRDLAGDTLSDSRGLGLVGELARALRQERLKRGAVVFPARPRPRAGRDAGLLPPPGEAAAAREEFALLASRAVGGLCRRQGAPSVYRVQSPVAEMVPLGHVLDPVGAHLQARALPRTVYQTEAGPWSGRGLEVSVPVAEPGESYLDLVMQRQVLARLGLGQALDEAGLQRAVEDTAAAREAAYEVRRSARRYWLLKVLEGCAGQPVRALVLERAGLGYVVELTGTGCRDYVAARDELTAGPGDTIEVVVEQASARRDVLRLTLS